MFDDDDKSQARKVVSQAEALENRFKVGGSKSEAFQDFGLCKDCGNFYAYVTKFNKRFAICQEFAGYAGTKIKLDPNDPIEYCTIYYKKGQMDIHSMKDMATMIDLARPIGFLKEEK